MAMALPTSLSRSTLPSRSWLRISSFESRRHTQDFAEAREFTQRRLDARLFSSASPHRPNSLPAHSRPLKSPGNAGFSAQSS